MPGWSAAVPEDHCNMVSETTPLIPDASKLSDGKDASHHYTITDTSCDAPRASLEVKRDQTTWKFEAAVSARHLPFLILTYLLQYSLSLTCIITVGRLGTAELGGSSMANLMANITGFAVYQGLGKHPL